MVNISIITMCYFGTETRGKTLFVENGDVDPGPPLPLPVNPLCPPPSPRHLLYCSPQPLHPRAHVRRATCRQGASNCSLQSSAKNITVQGHPDVYLSETSHVFQSRARVGGVWHPPHSTEPSLTGNGFFLSRVGVKPI